MNNIVQVILNCTYPEANKKIWQYDYGQILRIQGGKLPKAVEIHFSLEQNRGNSVTRIGTTQDGITEVPIPDSLLEANKTQDYSIYAFAYIEDGTSGNTEYRIRIPVRTRPKPEIHDTPEEAELFREAINAVNDAAGRANASEQNAKTSETEAGRYAEEAQRSAQETAQTKENALEEIGEQKQSAISAIKKQEESSIGNVTEHADTEIQRIQNKTSESKSELESSIEHAANQNVKLEESSQIAGEQKSELDKSIESAREQKSELINSVNAAEQTKTGLDESIQAATDKKAALDTTIGQANIADAALKKQIGSAEKIQENVEQIDKNKNDISSLKEDLVKVNKAIETNSKEDDKNKRKLGALWNLNRGVSYQFESDSEKAYQKKVPSGAKLMSITNIGGNTIESNDEFIDTKVDRIEIIGRNLFDENQKQQDITTPEGIRKGIIIGKGLGEVFASANNDNKYDIYYYLCCIKTDGSFRNPIKYFITKSGVSCGSFYVESDEEVFIYSARYNDTLDKIKNLKVQIEKGTVQTEYTPYFKDSIFIPESIKKMNGYGMSADSINNILDFENMRFVERIGILELGQLTWYKFSDENKKIFYAKLSGALNAYRILLSTKYNSTGDAFKDDKAANILNNILYIQDSDFMTESDFSSSVLGMKMYYEYTNEVVTDISNEIEKLNTSLIQTEDGMTISFINDRKDDTPVYSSIEYITSLSEVNA